MSATGVIRILLLAALGLVSCQRRGTGPVEQTNDLEARVGLLEQQVSDLMDAETRRQVKEEMESRGLKARDLRGADTPEAR